MTIEIIENNTESYTIHHPPPLPFRLTCSGNVSSISKHSCPTNIYNNFDRERIISMQKFGCVQFYFKHIIFFWEMQKSNALEFIIHETEIKTSNNLLNFKWI